MDWLDDGVYAEMLRRGISRRSFIKFSVAMATALALPTTYAPRIARALEVAPRIPLIWLRGQACGGDSQAFLQATRPTVAEILLQTLSVDYFDGLMAPAGSAAEGSRVAAMANAPAGYIAVIEGAVPGGDVAAAATIGGRPFRDVARDICAGATATIAAGSCAFDGGLSAAAGGATGAGGAGDVAPGDRLINLPGCPLNVENLTATLVHFLTFKELPPSDLRHRPLFAYGGLIHNQCERRAHYEFGEFVQSWGDEAAQKGWCLYKMGCKGPETFANCPSTRYASGTSWPVRAGHGCIGCTMPRFWDAMSPVYLRLPAPLPFLPGISSDQIGLAAVGGVAALAVGHGGASYVRGRRRAMLQRRRAAARAGQGLEIGLGEPLAVAPAATVATALEPPTVELARDAPSDMALQPELPVEPEAATDVGAAADVDAANAPTVASEPDTDLVAGEPPTFEADRPDEREGD